MKGELLYYIRTDNVEKAKEMVAKDHVRRELREATSAPGCASRVARQSAQTVRLPDSFRFFLQPPQRDSLKTAVDMISGMSALHVAAMFDAVNVATWLLKDCGVEARLPPRSSFSRRQFSFRVGRCTLRSSRGCSDRLSSQPGPRQQVDALDGSRRTPLFAAATHGASAAMQELLVRPGTPWRLCPPPCIISSSWFIRRL